MTAVDRILGASALLALSSGAVAASSVVRYKAVAVGGGTTSLGILGLLLASTALVTAVSGLGIPTSAVRTLSEHPRTSTDVGSKTVAVLRWRSFAIAFSVGLTWLVVSLQSVITDQSVSLTLTVAAVACSACTVAAAFDGAILNGLGRLKLLASINAAGAAFGAIVTVVVAWRGEPQQTVMTALVGAPVCLAILFAIARRRVAPTHMSTYALLSTRGDGAESRALVGLGVAVLAGASMAAASQLLVRSAIASNLGIESAGLYQATWSIASVYLGFVLTALGVEYFPRLTQHIDDGGRTRAAVQLQALLSLRLATPIILFLIIGADVLMRLLYTEAFSEAATLLRLFLVGDVVKVAAWAVVFVFAAKDMRRTVVATEVLFSAVFTVAALALLPIWGMNAVGVAWIATYIAYLALALVLLRRARVGGVSRAVVRGLAEPLSVASVVTLLVSVESAVAMTCALLLAAVSSVRCVLSIVRMRSEGSREA